MIEAFYDASSSMLSGIERSDRKSILKGTNLKP